ncbi:MAG: hypothetical protein AB8E82_12585, partial [Aureispira sp.]
MNYLELFQYDDLQKEFKWLSADNEELPLNYFPIQSAVNIIIGANNSRKSRFFRFLLAQEELHVSDHFLSEYLATLEKKLHESEELFTTGSILLENKKPIHPNDLKYFNNNPETDPVRKFINAGLPNKIQISHFFFEDFISNIKNIISNSKTVREDGVQAINQNSIIINLLANNSTINSCFWDYWNIKYTNTNSFKALKLIKELNEELQKFSNFNLTQITPLKTYLPTLRASIPLILDD